MATVSPKWLSDKEIARLAKAIRKERLGGISQLEVAKRIGRPGSQPEISRLEQGKGAGPRILMELASLAGLTVEHFQEGGEDVERQEKLAAAKWMRLSADRLQAEAEAPTSPAATAVALAHADAGEESQKRSQEPPAEEKAG